MPIAHPPPELDPSIAPPSSTLPTGAELRATGLAAAEPLPEAPPRPEAEPD